MDADDLLDILEDAIAVDAVQSRAEAFLVSKLPLFQGLPQTAEAQEQRLEWHEAYREYVSLMEDLVLSACAAQANDTREAVLAQLAEVAAGEAADRKHARFLLSMFEYSSFLTTMQELLDRQQRGLPLSFGSRPPKAAATSVAAGYNNT
ncbi:argF [Symbiodinium sp. CCMP2456]|nr:argF [Symbiodinium sp. CCMP2456]